MYNCDLFLGFNVLVVILICMYVCVCNPVIFLCVCVQVITQSTLEFTCPRVTVAVDDTDDAPITKRGESVWWKTSVTQRLQTIRPPASSNLSVSLKPSISSLLYASWSEILFVLPFPAQNLQVLKKSLCLPTVSYYLLMIFLSAGAHQQRPTVSSSVLPEMNSSGRICQKTWLAHSSLQNITPF